MCGCLCVAIGVQEHALRQRERGLRQERDNVRQQLDAAQQEVDANAQVGSETCVHMYRLTLRAWGCLILRDSHKSQSTGYPRA